MVYINLLPWRESRLKKQRLYFFVQLAIAVCLPLLVCAVIGLYQHQKVKARVAEIETIETTNQPLIAEINDFEVQKTSYQSQRPKIHRINRLLESRFNIPELLLFLQQQNLDLFEVNFLSISQKAFKLKATDSSSTRALSLLKNLRSESNFCQVRFMPLDNQDSSQLLKFELQAQFCDE